MSKVSVVTDRNAGHGDCDEKGVSRFSLDRNSVNALDAAPCR